VRRGGGLEGSRRWGLGVLGERRLCHRRYNFVKFGIALWLLLMVVGL